jgi:hypothetical protein
MYAAPPRPFLFKSTFVLTIFYFGKGKKEKEKEKKKGKGKKMEKLEKKIGKKLTVTFFHSLARDKHSIRFVSFHRPKICQFQFNERPEGESEDHHNILNYPN